MPAAELMPGMRAVMHSQDESDCIRLCPAGGTETPTHAEPGPGLAASVLQRTEEYNECHNVVQAVVDMMAGIGPFAVPAAQSGCQVRSLKALHPGATKFHINRRCRRGLPPDAIPLVVWACWT